MSDILKDLDKLMARIEDCAPIDDAGRASIDFIDMNYDAIRAALELQARVDAGWAVVPRQPTVEMLDAGQEEMCRWSARTHHDDAEQSAIYAAMLNAAPKMNELFGNSEQLGWQPIGWVSPTQVKRLAEDLNLTGIMVHDEQNTGQIRVYVRAHEIAAAQRESAE